MNLTTLLLDYDPQPLDVLRNRYAAALDPVYEVDEILGRAAIRPGECRSNVLDFPDGLRLIVSRERFRGKLLLHVSASARPDCEIFESIRQGEIGPISFCHTALARYREISGDALPMPPAMLSPGMGIPHWYREEGGAA